MTKKRGNGGHYPGQAQGGPEAAVSFPSSLMLIVTYRHIDVCGYINQALHPFISFSCSHAELTKIMGNIDGLDKAVAQFEKQAYDQSEGNNVRLEASFATAFRPNFMFVAGEQSCMCIPVWHSANAV